MEELTAKISNLESAIPELEIGNITRKLKTIESTANESIEELKKQLNEKGIEIKEIKSRKDREVEELTIKIMSVKAEPTSGDITKEEENPDIDDDDFFDAEGISNIDNEIEDDDVFFNAENWEIVTDS